MRLRTRTNPRSRQTHAISNAVAYKSTDCSYFWRANARLACSTALSNVNVVSAPDAFDSGSIEALFLRLSDKLVVHVATWYQAAYIAMKVGRRTRVVFKMLTSG